MEDKKQRSGSFYQLLLLILAGETIFLIPFVLPRIFRPTFLTVFEINNLQLGTCFSVYGIVALISYLLGGLIADRFSSNKLMAIALGLTALGGIYMATYPSITMLHVLYGYWGCTTILLFWAALLKATRLWGGPSNQGKAYGFLDGGRGFIAALIGTGGVVIFGYLMGDLVDVDSASRMDAFIQVIYYSVGLVLLVAIMVLLFLKEAEVDSEEDLNDYSFGRIKKALGYRSLWYLMVIILCGYVGYKVTDDFSLYASDVLKADEVLAAQIGTLLLYLRPVVGITIGILADRHRPSLFITGGFAVTVIGSIVMASGVIGDGTFIIFAIAVTATAVGTYAVRSLYFAVQEEGNIPLYISGTAIGLMSVIGYTPDIFMGPVMGYLLDSSPGALGHQHVFWVLAGFSLVGLVTSWSFSKRK